MNEIDFGNISGVLEIFSITKLTLLLFGVVLLGISVKLVTSFGSRLHNRIPSKRLFIAQVITMISFVIYIFGGSYLFYSVIQPPKALIVAVSGTLAVALGLSLKDLIASIVAGVILLFDRPFQVGDRVTFADVYGEIITIGLRAVRLVTLDDSVVTIPNSRFITDLVTSGNVGALDMMVEINFHLDLGTDLKLGRKILFETAATSKYIYLKKPLSVGFSEMEFALKPAMQLRVKGYVLDVRFERAFQTDVLQRGNDALRAAGIMRP